MWGYKINIFMRELRSKRVRARGRDVKNQVRWPGPQMALSPSAPPPDQSLHPCCTRTHTAERLPSLSLTLRLFFTYHSCPTHTHSN